ncbi:MAG: PLP-dependent aminotransferase family protein [Chloroflexota bacterium]
MQNSSPTIFNLAGIHLDRAAATPLQRQLYNRLRDAILSQQLASGVRLPSSRDLAAVLHVSRNTVINAFELLLAEGYLEARRGSGTYVSQTLPESLLETKGNEVGKTAVSAPTTDDNRPLSYMGVGYRKAAKRPSYGSFLNHHFPTFPFSTPDLSLFPFDIWAKLTAKQYKTLPATTFLYGHGSNGYRPLREAIAAHLRVTRSINCVPEQIIITTGSQQGIYLTGRVMLNPRDDAWFENPGYAGARYALMSTGATLHAIDVDEQGLVVADGLAKAPHARLAYISPSHQFPLGYTMSLARRGALLAWAEAEKSWILEDDYDSEYRYAGSPLTALAGLDRHNRVIYAGTFSKLLFPMLRLGYLVVPPDLIGTFQIARNIVDLAAPLVSQMVLANFISEGHFTRHIRRTRIIYAKRRACLLDALKPLASQLAIIPADTGMHLTALLPEGMDDTVVAEAAYAQGISLVPLSHLSINPLQRGGLVFGFTSANEAQICEAAAKLALILERQ